MAISPLDGTGCGRSPPTGSLYHQLADGSIEPVLGILVYQAADPDPVDIDEPPNPGELNPYGLTSQARRAMRWSPTQRGTT